MAILAALERMEGMTQAERDLAAYICGHADDVVEMGISELASAAFSSNATIIRLCRKVGAEGYRDFRVGLAQDVERRRSTGQSVDVDHPIGPGQNPAAIMGGLGRLLKQAVDEAQAAVRPGDVERAARLIGGARRVYIFAVGDSLLSAMTFGNLLLKLGIPCVNANEFDEELAVAHTLGPSDVALFVSYTGRVVNGVMKKKVLQVIKERGCRSVWVSSAPTPVGFDVCLRFPARESDAEKIATFYSQACIRYILDCVYGVIFAQDYDGHADDKAAIDEAENMVATLRGLSD